ncbi:BURP domain-containing protein BNM2C-like [Salvia miltiorrhiza]|uniref:BURP domain-containing protein BNM2C-like n=1 Tax=Salvia miltiorrhiza TaxID=226208 RepID=UPI0025AC1E62|nr:BURP domain-containing protein BNM2C-like [Salvia miltiorrhiza]
MYAKLTICTLLLHLVILMDSCNGAVIDNHIQKHHVHSHSHHLPVNASDPELVVFFLSKDLKLGNTMKIYFPKRELSDSLTHLLSKEEADSIPFSSQNLPQILRLFSFSDGSPQATAMADTLDACEGQPIQGEKKICATSLKSMSEFLETIFGSDTPIEALSTSHLKHDDGVVQRYRIMGIQQVPSPKLVSCHTMPYAYTVFYCHYHDSDNRVYRVSLAGENGDAVEAVTVCHMDTSQWPRTHVSFGVLGVEPGSTPVCHFFPADHFVWVPLMSALQM